MVARKLKTVYRGIPINIFVGLKPKMNSMLSDDGKESNTEKGVNTATEFNEFRDTLFNRKVVGHKMKRFKVKNTNLEHMELKKILISCFDDKRFALNDVCIRLLVFIKT